MNSILLGCGWFNDIRAPQPPSVLSRLEATSLGRAAACGLDGWNVEEFIVHCQVTEQFYPFSTNTLAYIPFPLIALLFEARVTVVLTLSIG